MESIQIPDGFTDTGYQVYLRTYSRLKEDETRETWSETVRRVVDGNLSLGGRMHDLPNEREDLIRLIESHKLVPAGRHLYMSGVQGRQFLFNCHVSGWTDNLADHFTFTFLRLMEGGGVGANYSMSYLKDCKIWRPIQVKLYCSPEHPDYEGLKPYLSDTPAGRIPVYIEDSREGWAGALGDVITATSTYKMWDGWRGIILVDPSCGQDEAIVFYDLSAIRPSGSPIKTFGGTAAGPVPLAKMLKRAEEILNAMWLECGVMTPYAMELDHAIAECVISGNVRRSARMSIVRWDDPWIDWFLSCKEDTSHHWSTNISVEIDEEFIRHVRAEDFCDDINKRMLAQRVWRRICEGMLKNGEPGFWDSSLANMGEVEKLVATNPCITGDTMIATVDYGPVPIATLARWYQPVKVYAWHPHTKRPVVRLMRNIHMTGSNAEIVEVSFDSGLKVRCTPGHNFYSFRGRKVKASELKPGSSVRAWSMSEHRDGHLRVHSWSSETNKSNHQWVHRMVWEEANGPIPPGMIVHHRNENPDDNRLENLELKTVTEHNQEHYSSRYANGFDGKCKNHKVISVEPCGRDDVYNGTVDDAHTYIIVDPNPVSGCESGIVSANCGEIGLAGFENCNLGHVNLAMFVDADGRIDWDDLYLAHRLMSRFLVRATYGDISDEKQRAIVSKNRRIGVGHLGYQWFVNKQGIKYSESHLDENIWDNLCTMRGEVRIAADELAFQLRIPAPIKVTCVAPTGTISKMSGVTSGIQPIIFKYFILRVRFSSVDPDQLAQVEEYRRKGYNVLNDIYSANTLVVEIPSVDPLVQALVDSGMDPDIVEESEEISLQDMLSVQKMYQTYYADNAVSFTANLSQDHLDTLGKTPAERVSGLSVALRPFLGSLKGTTLMVSGTRPMAPYERITEGEHEEYLQFLDAMQASAGDGCASGACPVR